MTSDEDRGGLVLYHTAGCHLCELAEAIARPLAAARGLRLRLVDIAASDELTERYGTRIPVLADASALGEEIGWPFDEAAAARLLDGLS